VPDELWNEGMTEYRDLLKVVACTEPCEATRFRQDKIGVRYERPATRGAAGMNSLERLMGRTMTRDIGDDSEDSVIADWTTAELGITTVRPLEGAAVPEAGGRTELSPHLRVAGHPQLRANISLSTVPLSCRDAAGAPPLPAWLRDAPACVQPFQLAPSRSVEAGLSVLELTEVSNHATVTPEQPLTLALDAQLDDGEHLLTVAWDAESGLYLPLGRATATDAGVEVRLERLPAPSSSRRSLTGSIKIFFQKVISERLGRDFEYPLLRMADPAGGYIADLDEIRDRVDASSRILLYIHGITGDTRGMVKSAFHQGHGATAPPLGERYDLVLAYDYENLNTEIQGNARALQERLAQVGLAGGHGKSLHIVAHSMGGLVSRWFIEHLGGNEVVEHLVMLGTPNGGSPWATVEDWVAGAIGIGLNGLSNILWPAEVLGALLEKFESAVGVSLAQMEPGSEFLEDLAGGTDPAVRYSIVAGNTSLLAGDLQPDAGGKSRVQRLLERLNLQRFFHTTASLAFFGAPNDVAASVVSITSVPAGFARLDPPREVECDHMSYFATAAGLRALSEALD
jgi:pimeloyl-ACP methyl ester carboxylesterase